MGDTTRTLFSLPEGSQYRSLTTTNPTETVGRHHQPPQLAKLHWRYAAWCRPRALESTEGGETCNRRELRTARRTPEAHWAVADARLRHTAHRRGQVVVSVATRADDNARRLWMTCLSNRCSTCRFDGIAQLPDEESCKCRRHGVANSHREEHPCAVGRVLEMAHQVLKRL